MTEIEEAIPGGIPEEIHGGVMYGKRWHKCLKWRIMGFWSRPSDGKRLPSGIQDTFSRNSKKKNPFEES